MLSRLEEAVEELNLKRVSPGLFIPGYDGYSLPNLSNSLAKLMSVRARGRALNDDFLLGFRNIDRVVLIIMDAMGLNIFIKSSNGIRKFLNDLLLKEGVCFKVLTSVFPSTTSTALTSLNTGLTPQEHGIVAYVLFMKELSSMVNMISLSPVNDERRNRIFELGMSAEKLLGAKVLTQRIKESGLKSKTLIRYGIRNSGLSTILYRDSEIVPALTTVDFVTNLVKLINDKKADFIMAYWDGFDAQSHYYGPFSQEAELELLNTFTLLKTVINKVAPDVARRTLLVVTSDHGQSKVRDEESIRIEELKWLNDNLLMPPAGESRAAYLYVKNGSKEFESVFRKKISKNIVLFRSRKLLEKGIFGLGEVNRCVLDRIGDYVALSRGEGRLIFHYDLKERTEPEFVRAGAHGSLTLNELLVPLIVCRLSELLYT
ncbi:MAG: alkaline phosphatase family protein [Thermoproteota archaeon]